MTSKALHRGLSMTREMIRDTGRGVWALYALLVAVGVALVILGWQAEVHGWTTDHPYFVGLLDGATGFCFGVPIAGVVITGITRRAARITEQRTAVRAVVAQLDYLDRLIQGLSLGSIELASDRLRDLARSAQLAALRASVEVRLEESVVRWWVVSAGVRAMAALPRMDEEIAANLRPAVEGNKLWASVGFSCSRLGSDITRLVTMVYPPMSSQKDFPSWLDELIGALQTLLVIQLPPRRKWLPAAVKDPPGVVPVSFWSLQTDAKPIAFPVISPSDQSFRIISRKLLGKAERSTSSAKTAERIKNATQEEATNEFKDELLALAHDLDALAALVDAAGACRDELVAIRGHQLRMPDSVTVANRSSA